MCATTGPQHNRTHNAPFLSSPSSSTWRGRQESTCAEEPHCSTRPSRWFAASSLFGLGLLELSPGDLNYCTLPLYHSNAMFAGWGAALTTGGGILLRRKFSASQFWSDVRAHDATSFIYIGELLRYLMNQPPSPDDPNHKIRVITGNGLRPDIWEKFVERFGIEFGQPIRQWVKSSAVTRVGFEPTTL